MCDGNVMYGGQDIHLGVLFKNNNGILPELFWSIVFIP